MEKGFSLSITLQNVNVRTIYKFSFRVASHVLDSHPETALNRSMEQIIELSGYPINTKVEGEGPPVLLLHSYWGSLLLFDEMAGELSKTRKVIRIDLPGHGNSATPPPGYRFDSFAVVLNELLQRLNIAGKISIIGHSMGGYVAMAFAERFPERMESLILMHSPVRRADDQSIKSRNREADLLRKGKEELLLQVTVPSNFASGQDGNMAKTLAMVMQTSKQVTLDGALRSIEAMNHRNNYLKFLQNQTFPVFIIVGKHDKVYDAEGQLEDGFKIPCAEILFLEHSGHMGFLEESIKVLSRLKQFLDQI